MSTHVEVRSLRPNVFGRSTSTTATAMKSLPPLPASTPHGEDAGPRGDEAARNMPAVAENLGVTATQLLNLFKKEPAAWTALNRLRTGAGLAALK